MQFIQCHTMVFVCEYINIFHCGQFSMFQLCNCRLSLQHTNYITFQKSYNKTRKTDLAATECAWSNEPVTLSLWQQHTSSNMPYPKIVLLHIPATERNKCVRCSIVDVIIQQDNHITYKLYMVENINLLHG